jgi:D-2-hydroxyacid dehydrogenase (NADP+)
MKRSAPAETKILICVWHRFTLWRTPPELAVRVRERWPEMNVVHLPSYERMNEELPDTDIFVGYSLRPEQFLQARRLRWIHSTAAGVAQLMYPELRASNVLVTKASGVHSIPMGEHILGTLVAVARQFPAAVRYQLARRWAQQEIWDSPLRPRELVGQVLLVVGFGATGRALAQRAKPLGMKIWAVTRSGKADPALADRVFPATQLDRALPEADFVVLAAPETPETHHLIRARQLAAMKRTAFLVNMARGSLVDEAALIEALEQRAIAGAALDVAEEEPLPPESRLWSLENVFLTPHISAVSESLWDRQAQLLLENLDRWFSGCDLLNRVDLKRGY